MSEDYVTNEDWVRTVGRPDAIDDIADQFERPAAQWSEPSTPATRPVAARWPRASQGWRSLGLWHPRSAERLHS